MERTEIQRRVQELEPWVVGFEYEGVRYSSGSGREFLLTQKPDDRAKSFFDNFPHARRVLELGALEGNDSLALARNPGVSVLALEGRPENLARAELAVEVHGADNVELRLADVENLDFQELGRFDAVLCAGLLYHVQEPWKLLADIGGVTDGLYLSTHYWGSTEETDRFEGYTVKTVREEHPEAQARGLSVNVRWLDRASLFEALEKAGFSDVRVVHERRTAGICNIIAACRRGAGDN